ncbi:MAG: PaaI family thioesterase [Chloroflexi bacterium]|nr:PaaI family thioesterase [Chloroflexota bacterium]
MNREEHFRKLECMYLAAPVNEYYAPTIHISRGEAQVSIQVRPEFFHAAGAVHGVVYFKLLDDSSFFAANSHVEDVFVLTVSYNLYFIRPVSKGVMTATGKVVQASQRLIIAESVIHDSNGKEVGRGSGTFMPSSTSLSEEIGYK